MITTDAKSLAAEFGVSPRTIRKLAAQRRIPCFRLGHRTLRFDREAVLQRLQETDATLARQLPSVCSDGDAPE
jgi:excisionase family DNA binding protein